MPSILISTFPVKPVRQRRVHTFWCPLKSCIKCESGNGKGGNYDSHPVHKGVGAASSPFFLPVGSCTMQHFWQATTRLWQADRYIFCDEKPVSCYMWWGIGAPYWQVRFCEQHRTVDVPYKKAGCICVHQTLQFPQICNFLHSTHFSHYSDTAKYILHAHYRAICAIWVKLIKCSFANLVKNSMYLIQSVIIQLWCHYPFVTSLRHCGFSTGCATVLDRIGLCNMSQNPFQTRSTSCFVSNSRRYWAILGCHPQKG